MVVVMVMMVVMVMVIAAIVMVMMVVIRLGEPNRRLWSFRRVLVDRRQSLRGMGDGIERFGEGCRRAAGHKRQCGCGAENAVQFLVHQPLLCEIRRKQRFGA